MRGIQFAEQDLLPDRRPANFATQGNIQSLSGEEAKLLRDDEWRAVIQRDEAEPQIFWRTAAAGIDGCR